MASGDDDAHVLNLARRWLPCRVTGFGDREVGGTIRRASPTANFMINAGGGGEGWAGGGGRGSMVG
ncbi:hypothetical protein GCM10027186_47360 [Micromonospora schwarzwaldensis]